MSFNFKVRAKNPLFWISNVVAVLVYIGGYLGVKGEDVTSWDKLFSILGDVISNPYLIVMIIVTFVTTAISYTDKGIRDTGFVNTLTNPRDDKDPSQAVGFISEKEDSDEHSIDEEEDAITEGAKDDTIDDSYNTEVVDYSQAIDEESATPIEHVSVEDPKVEEDTEEEDDKHDNPKGGK